MLLKLFRTLGIILIGKVSDEKKAMAMSHFTTLMGVLAEKAAKGAVEGAKSK